MLTGENYRRYTKPFIDFVLATLGLLLALPLILLVCAFIALESPGNPIFLQNRVGLGQRSFTLIKLRSMRRQTTGEKDKFTTKNDSRITRTGKFIRKTRIDELPQLLNVILGDMSIVGPRPEQVSFANEFSKKILGYDKRHTVRPGITGLAQITGGYVSNFENTRLKCEIDLRYIENMSLVTDLVIMVKTIGVLTTGKGAR